MKKISMTPSIASRVLTYEGPDGRRRDVAVTLGTPVLATREPHDAWACPYEISGFEGPVVRAIYGIDAMQALILALHTLPSELRSLARHDGGKYLNEDDLGLDHACRVHLDMAG